MPSSSPWTGSAFGLRLTSEPELPGLARGAERPDPCAARSLTVRLGAAGREPARAWGKRAHESRDADGGLLLAIHHCPRRDYRFQAPGAGVFELAADGRLAVCRPAGAGPWAWRRYLIGQVLPFAALLQGLEVLHASAVELDGVAVALAGPSGSGKSTLALNMHLAGAGFLADDVLAVERVVGEGVAHPGPAVAKVRHVAVPLLADGAAERLGEPIAADVEETVHEVEPVAGPSLAGAPPWQFPARMYDCRASALRASKRFELARWPLRPITAGRRG